MLWQSRRAGRKCLSAMWHAVWFVVGVDKGPRPHGGGDADGGGGCEGCMAEERMGSGGDTDNGGMSEERVGAWAHGKGRVGDADDGGRREECVVNRVLHGYSTGHIPCVPVGGRQVDSGWVVSVCMGCVRDASNVS